MCKECVPSSQPGVSPFPPLVLQYGSTTEESLNFNVGWAQMNITW